mgnify:CR=1 FL=1
MACSNIALVFSESAIVLLTLTRQTSLLTLHSPDLFSTRLQVPYRDSKLTKLLIHSLGGNSRTMMLSCISGATSAIPETLRTLHFSMSAARIKNKPLRFMDPVEKLILELREEIKRLKTENRVLKSNLQSAPNSAAVSMKSFSVPGGGGGGDSKSHRNSTESKLVSVKHVG